MSLEVAMRTHGMAKLVIRLLTEHLVQSLHSRSKADVEGRHPVGLGELGGNCRDAAV